MSQTPAPLHRSTLAPGFYRVTGMPDGCAEFWLVRVYHDIGVNDNKPYACAWGLSLWGPRDQPKTWAYRTYGNFLADLLDRHPAAVWTPDRDRVTEMPKRRKPRSKTPRMPDITKGSRVRVSFMQALPLGSYSLAGVQMKVAAVSVDFTGTCRHFRGDTPLNPTTVRVYVEPDGPIPETVARTRPYGCTCEGHDRLVEVKPEWLVAADP